MRYIEGDSYLQTPDVNFGQVAVNEKGYVIPAQNSEMSNTANSSNKRQILYGLALLATLTSCSSSVTTNPLPAVEGQNRIRITTEIGPQLKDWQCNGVKPNIIVNNTQVPPIVTIEKKLSNPKEGFVAKELLKAKPGIYGIKITLVDPKLFDTVSVIAYDKDGHVIDSDKSKLPLICVPDWLWYGPQWMRDLFGIR